MLYLVILLCFVFFAGVAMTINEGLWSNSVLLLVVMLGGILAFSVGAPLGGFAAEKADASDEYTWHVVFACVWGVFFISVTIMRILLEKASKTRLKFLPPLEMIAGPLMGLFVAVMFTSFSAYTLANIPIRAGYWNTGDAAPWQVTFFNMGQTPFYNVMSKSGFEGISVNKSSSAAQGNTNPSETASSGGNSGGTSAEETIKQFVLTQMKGDLEALGNYSLPHDELSVLVAGPRPPAEVIEQMELQVASQQFRVLQVGDVVDLPNGEKKTMDAEFINKDRQQLMGVGMPIPFDLKRVDGVWKVNPEPMIEARKAAQQAR